MRIFIKNILNGLLKDKKQCLGIGGMILLSVILISTLYNVNIAISKNVDRVINEGNQQDFNFIADWVLSDEDINNLSEKYNFDYEERSYKNIEDNSLDDKYYFRFLTPTEEINTPIVIDGDMPKNNNEIAINTNFVEDNDYSIGDKIKINNKEYILSATVVFPDYISPIVKVNSTIYSSKTEALVISTDEEFNRLEADKVLIYSGKFNGEISNEEIEEMKNDESFINILFNKDNFSINNINAKMNMNSIIILVSMTCLISIVVLMLILFLSKKINSEKQFLGVMKAHGVKTFKLSIAYCIYSIVIVVPTVICGYIISLILAPIFEKSYNYGFSLPISNYKFDISILGVLILVPLIIMIYTTIICVYFSLRNRTVDLLNDVESSSESKSTRFIGKIIKTKNFISTLKMNFMMSNKKLILLCIFGAYCVGLQMILSINIYKMPNNMVTEEFKGRNYKYNTNLLESEEADLKIDGEYEAYYTVSGEIIEINKSGKKNKEAIDINVIAMNSESEMIELYENDKNINSYLDKGLIINEVLMAGYGLKSGDEITITVNNKSITAKIYGVSQFQSNKDIYTSFEFLKQNNIELEGINGIFSNEVIENESVIAITNQEELKKNFEDSIEMMKSAGILQAVIGIVLGCFIIGITTNTLIKDNKKNLRLMMALGYTQKEINKSCLKVYTPFVIVGFMMSIPNSFLIMKMMFNEIAKTSSMCYPVRFDVISISISFIVTMIVYYFTINKDKSKIAKISLSEVMQ